MAVELTSVCVNPEVVLGKEIEVAGKFKDSSEMLEGSARRRVRIFNATSELHPEFEIWVYNAAKNADAIEGIQEVTLSGVRIVNDSELPAFGEEKDKRKRQRYVVVANELRVKK